MNRRIRVHFVDGCQSTGVLSVKPRWWQWLLGQRETDEVIICVPAVGGGVIWIRDLSGRRIINAEILDEIQRARCLSEWLQRKADFSSRVDVAISRRRLT